MPMMIILIKMIISLIVIRYNDLLMTADANNDDSGSEVFKNGKKQYDNLASVEIDSNQWRLTQLC